MPPPLSPMYLPTAAYYIDNTNGTISSSGVNINNAMLVQTFLTNITKGYPAQTLKALSAGGTPKADTDMLTNGDVLEVTAENGTVKQYTITVPSL